MKKSYNDLIGLNNAFAQMSRERWPFGIILAKNIKIIDALILDYNEQRQAVIDKYAKRDEDGNILGIEQPVNNNELAEGETPEMKRVENPTGIDQVDWTDREKFDKDLATLNEQEIEFELIPVDVKGVYFSTQANRDMQISDYINSNMETSLVLYLMEFGFFTNLEV